MRYTTMLVATAVIGGVVAFGDHHISGAQVNCTTVPHECYDECLALKFCLDNPEGGDIGDCAAERSALAGCEAASGGGPGGGGGVIIVPACPGGQHYHAGGGCHADHECGDGEVGGGDEDCEACPDGTEPNEAGTACEPDGSYRVAKCTRPVEALPGIGEYLPHHVNVVSESLPDDRMELGFFAVDMTHALLSAWAYRQLGIRQFTTGSLERDPNLGQCTYKDVSKGHFETVRNRMKTYKWYRYHLVLKNYGKSGYGSCITWAEAVTGG